MTTSRGRRLALCIWLIVGLWAFAAATARAALPPGCTQSGTMVSCSYTTPGQQPSLVVPAGVTSVRVYAVGGSGGFISTVRHVEGAPGAVVAGNLAVSPGSVLSIQVAGDGTSTGPGAGGGGAGCTGGGGASTVSTASGPLVVAAGGGGDGCYGSGGGGSQLGLIGGYGGAAGADGDTEAYGNAGGGAAGTSTGGGAGGAGGTGIVNGNPGAVGSAGIGGAGGNGASGAGASGGGGGGGVYGGGGGGQGAYELVDDTPTRQPGGGGGGGSSLVPAGGSLELNFPDTSRSLLPSPPMVVISYTAPTSTGTPSPGTIVPPGSPGSGSIPHRPARVRLTVSQAHARWRRGNKLPELAAIVRVRQPPVGTIFRFRLSGAAAVRFAFTQSRPGRRVGGRCLALTPRNRRKRRCSRTVSAGSFRFSASAGAYSVRFQGRISRSAKLKPGRYKLTVTATNTAGSTSQRLAFTIVS